ncbi:SOS response-associated peptidase [Paenibacillus protaetiae]|uniref:Abasic site processing protein n=1 Tax=Paenibacillus protaetiae TaxID=2509456 RepID=A0A4P6EV59_9BACL|nr:SOS response-associated peptidase [Paenibacillus protaetiae]QAY65539.1 SOS response-associated peptidase [Paenibacillus protaetiae]
MCGRYTLTVTLDELMAHYWINGNNVPFHQPKYNIAPGQLIPAIIHDGTTRRLGELKWGLVPPWADDPKTGFMMINARAETAAAKPAFAGPLQRKRCLIPADGFYEWKITASGKQPMRIVMRNRTLFSMAGLYESWIAPDGSKVSTCTIVTTQPNELKASIHNRMPVILPPEAEQIWLDRSITSTAELQKLLQPYPPEEMEAYAVSAAVGSVRNDSPELILPIPQADQLELF